MVLSYTSARRQLFMRYRTFLINNLCTDICLRTTPKSRKLYEPMVRIRFLKGAGGGGGGSCKQNHIFVKRD